MRRTAGGRVWPTDHAAERGLLAPGTADLAFNENIAVHATECLASGNAVALVVETPQIGVNFKSLSSDV